MALQGDQPERHLLSVQCRIQCLLHLEEHLQGHRNTFRTYLNLISWCIMGAGVLPACCISLHIIQAVTDVISLGFATTVFPAAMAGAIFQVSRYRGRFQGLIRPATHTKTPFTNKQTRPKTLSASTPDTLSSHPLPQDSGWCSSGSPCGPSGCSRWCGGVPRRQRSGSCTLIGECPPSLQM